MQQGPARDRAPDDAATTQNVGDSVAPSPSEQSIAERLAEVFDLTARGIYPRIGITGPQWSRYSLLTLEGVVALRRRSLVLFEAALRLGKMMRKDGSFDRIRNAEDAVCVEVRLRQRDQALKLLKINRRTWERAVVQWEKARMAHRCPGLTRGHVRLFFSPQSVCPVPSCREEL